MRYFSVIIPCYNGKKTIVKAMESVINQTYENFELIVVNNGSTDDTKDVVEKFIKENPNYDIKLFSQENKGISGSRNRGIKESQYDYISLLDADDTWYVNKLETVKNYIEKYPHIDIFSNREMIVTKEYSKPTNPRDLKEPFFKDLLINGNCLSPSAVTMKREAILAVGGFSMELTGGQEDYDCWLRLAKNGAEICIIHEVLGELIMSGQSFSADYVSHASAIFKMVMLHFENACKDGIISENDAVKYKKILDARYHYSLGRQHANSRRNKEARKELVEAIRLNPMLLKPYLAFVLTFLR